MSAVAIALLSICFALDLKLREPGDTVYSKEEERSTHWVEVGSSARECRAWCCAMMCSQVMETVLVDGVSILQRAGEDRNK